MYYWLNICMEKTRKKHSWRIVPKTPGPRRLYARTTDSDWEHFHNTMTEMVITCRDPQLAAWLDYLHKKVDVKSEA